MRADVEAIWQPPRWYIDPGRAGQLGIVCGTHLFVWRSHDPRQCGGVLGEPIMRLDLLAPLSEEPTIEAAPGHDLGALATLLHALKLRAIWLVPLVGGRPSAADLLILREWSGVRPARLREQHPQFAWRELSARGPGGMQAVLGGLTIRHADVAGEAEGAYRCVYATWPQDPWALTQALAELPEEPQRRAQLVASALLTAEWLLGVQFWWSPAHSGLTLLRSCLQHWARPEHGLSIEPLTADWQREMRGPLRTFDVRWARPVAAHELPPGGGLVPVWTYDRNMSYVASASAVTCGGPFRTFTLQPSLPGVYRVSGTAPAGWDQRTPGLMHVGDGSGTYPLAVCDVWAWEPFVRAALRFGWDVRIHEGWYWPASTRHSLLSTWHERVVRAREDTSAMRVSTDLDVRHVGALASKLVKRLGVATIGRLMPGTGRAVLTAEEAEAGGFPVEWHVTDERGRLTGLVEARTPLGRTDLLHPEWWNEIVSTAGARVLSITAQFAPLSTAGLYTDCLYSLHPIPRLSEPRQTAGAFSPRGVVLVPRDVLAAGKIVELVKAAKHGPAYVGEAVASA